MINKCPKHPKYKGIKPPKCQCKACVLVYMNVLGAGKIFEIGNCISNILFNYSQKSNNILTMTNQTFLKGFVEMWDDAWRKFRKNTHVE